MIHRTYAGMRSLRNLLKGTVIRNAARTTRTGKGAAAAPEVKISRIDIKSMLCSILIIVVFCGSGLSTGQKKRSFLVFFCFVFIETGELTQR